MFRAECDTNQLRQKIKTTEKLAEGGGQTFRHLYQLTKQNPKDHNILHSPFGSLRGALHFGASCLPWDCSGKANIEKVVATQEVFLIETNYSEASRYI